jgi:hypothetical protein
MDTKNLDAESDRFAGLKGKRFDFNPAEKRCLALSLAPVERLRREAARIEIDALVEARAFAVERLGLPQDCQVRIVRENGTPTGIEVVLPHAAQASVREGSAA